MGCDRLAHSAWWAALRVLLSRSLGVVLPTYVAHNGEPIGP